MRKQPRTELERELWRQVEMQSPTPSLKDLEDLLKYVDYIQEDREGAWALLHRRNLAVTEALLDIRRAKVHSNPAVQEGCLEIAIEILEEALRH